VTAVLMLGIAAYGLPLGLWARLRGPVLAGASFLLGAGAITLHLFALSLAGIAWTRTSMMVSLVPLFVVATVLVLRRAPGMASAEPEMRPGIADLFVLVAVVAYAIFALYAPPYEWDFYGIWGNKARWFFDARGVDWAYLTSNGTHPDYPLLLPLLFDFTALVLGGWSDAAFGWVFVAMCVSFLLIARGHSSSLVALAVVFPALNLWIGLAEAAVMAFGCAGLLFLRREQYGIGAVMLGFAAWSKNEGLALIVAALIALVIAKRRWLVLWPAIAIIAPWMIVRRIHELPTDLAQGETAQRIWARIIDPAATLEALATAPPDQPYLWLVILAIVLVYVRSAWQRERFLLVALVLQSAALVVPLLATPFDLAGHAQFSLNRIPHQIAPAAAFLAALLVTRGLSAPFPSAGSPPPPRPSTG
jgi:hypothetical protein